MVELQSSNGRGLVIPPVRQGRFLDEHAIGKKLRKALEATGLWIETADRGRRLNWYRCTRHTFASHFVAAGGSLERLKDIMGHSSFAVTLRYAHLVPGAFSAADRSRIAFDFSAAGGEVIPLRGPADEGQMRDGAGSEASRASARRAAK